MLFFGCRHRASDCLYADEWDGDVARGALALHLACSRDQDAKVYVQHRLLEAADHVCRWIVDRGACIVVAGCVAWK